MYRQNKFYDDAIIASTMLECFSRGFVYAVPYSHPISRDPVNDQFS